MSATTIPSPLKPYLHTAEPVVEVAVEVPVAPVSVPVPAALVVAPVPAVTVVAPAPTAPMVAPVRAAVPVPVPVVPVPVPVAPVPVAVAGEEPVPEGEAVSPGGGDTGAQNRGLSDCLRERHLHTDCRSTWANAWSSGERYSR